MLPAETLKLLIDRTHPGPDIITTDREPPHVYFVRQPDGTFERQEAEMLPLSVIAAGLATVARMVQAYSPGSGPEVYYTRERVVALLKPGCRVQCTLPLAPSPQLATLMAWDRAGRFTTDQAGFVRLLRTVFADCYRDYPKLLANVRKLRTTRAGEVNAEIQKGKVSLGKSTIAEMSGIDDIPEEVAFRVPVFAAAALYATADVRVCVEPNPERESFDLTVIPGQVEQAFAKGEAWLAAKLSGELADAGAKDVPVYFGSP